MCVSFESLYDGAAGRRVGDQSSRERGRVAREVNRHSAGREVLDVEAGVTRRTCRGRGIFGLYTEELLQRRRQHYNLYYKWHDPAYLCLLCK